MAFDSLPVEGWMDGEEINKKSCNESQDLKEVILETADKEVACKKLLQIEDISVLKEVAKFAIKLMLEKVVEEKIILEVMLKTCSVEIIEYIILRLRIKSN